MEKLTEYHSPNKLLLIDTFYFMHRSFHGFPKDFATSTGIHTNISFGFAQALLNSITEFNPTHIACGWESEELPSFRKTLFEDYQKDRVPMDEEDAEIFREQIPWVIKIIDAFNIPRLTANGFEGDDALGTAAAIASKDAEVIIATSDQDLLQLIDDHIKVYRPARPPFVKKELFDCQTFEEKYGFKPKQMIDYKALRGDPSDSIPGVQGIGDKTAKDLISKYCSIENIYENIDSISGSVKQKLLNGKEMAFMSKQLATIITNIPMKFDLNTAEVHDFDEVKAREIFEELEFKSLIPKINNLVRHKRILETINRPKKVEESLQGSLFT